MPRKKVTPKPGFDGCRPHDGGGVTAAPRVHLAPGGKPAPNVVGCQTNLWAALVTATTSKPPTTNQKNVFRGKTPEKREAILQGLLPPAHGGTASWGTCSKESCGDVAHVICFE